MKKTNHTSAANVKDLGQKALLIQSKSLNYLAKNIPPEFSDAIQILMQCEGKIIVSGLGKSGHIGKKLAATLASTGSPAQFIHTTEASHGDLGMIKNNDAIIILSNSGETPGIVQLLDYSKRFSIPSIAITAGLKSTLAKRSDVLLGLKKIQEACPIGLAPTTSTTLTLALGDTIAVTLMQLKNFSPSDFKVFHPGGKIGSELLTVQELMHVGSAVPLINQEEKMQDAIITITQKGFGAAGIVDNHNTIIGIITDGDLRRNIENLLILKASEVMTKNPRIIGPETLASEALKIMSELKITSLFVCSAKKKTLGVIHLHDCLRAGIV